MSANRIAAIDVDVQKTFTPLCPDELPVPYGDEIVSSQCPGPMGRSARDD